METRANYALVGLFTLAVIAAAFGFVYWFRAASSNGERTEYRVIFTGSVSGLTKGAQARFNGIPVGQVMSISLLPDDPSRAVAMVAVDPNTPIRTDTRARLEYQGLTGVASIHFSGKEGNAPRLANPDGKGAPTIYADRSDFQDLFETAQRLAAKVDGVVDRVDKILADGEAPLANTLRNVEGFSKAINENSPGISAFIVQMTATAQRFASLSDRVDKLAEAADGILRGVDAQSVNRTLANVEGFSKQLADNKANIDSFLAEASSLTKRLNEAAPKLDTTLTEAARVMRSLDAEKINKSIENIDKFAARLGENAPQVDQILRDAADITKKVSVAADRLDGVLKAAQSFLGDDSTSGAAKSVMAEIGEAAKSIRLLAGNLDKRTAQITAGINRATGPGLREIEALASDARKAVNDVGRAVRNLERNPSQLITGGRSNIPEYSGSR